jgi:hypothetical protein
MTTTLWKQLYRASLVWGIDHYYHTVCYLKASEALVCCHLS